MGAHLEEDATKARIDLMVRANDPLYELSFHIHTSRLEDEIWTHMLNELAASFGSTGGVVQRALIDKRRQWRAWRNIWKNSAVRTLLRRDRR